MDWLHEEGVDGPSNINKIEGPSRKRAKNAATEEYSDATKDIALEISTIEQVNATCQSLPSADACPLDGMGAQSNSKKIQSV